MTFTHELCPPYRVSMKELKAYIRASDEQMCSKANCTDFLCGSKWFGIFAFFYLHVSMPLLYLGQFLITTRNLITIELHKHEFIDTSIIVNRLLILISFKY